MANSLIAVISSRQPQKIDPQAFKPKTGGDLDIVTEGNIKKLEKKKENSVEKIVTYKPIRLKSAAEYIELRVRRRKESSELREAQSTIVKEKVKETKEKNPFSNPIERQVGEHINTKA